MAGKKHTEYQRKLIEIGQILGFTATKRHKQDPQGDAVWYQKIDASIYKKKRLPVMAFEILCSETPKGIKGSIATLQHISPSLAILVIIDEEYKRKSRHYGYTGVQLVEYIKRKCNKYSKGVKLTQRIEVWNQKKIDSLYKKLIEKDKRYK